MLAAAAVCLCRFYCSCVLPVLCEALLVIGRYRSSFTGTNSSFVTWVLEPIKGLSSLDFARTLSRTLISILDRVTCRKGNALSVNELTRNNRCHLNRPMDQ